MSETSGAAPRPAGKFVRLADVVRPRPGNSKLIKGKLPSEPGSGLFPAFSASGQDVYMPSHEHSGNAVVISAVGARCGKCFLAAGKWSAIANTHVLLPDESRIDTRFLWYRVNDERFWVRGGSAQPFVRVRDSLEKEVFLPDIQSQREIVAEIEKQFSRLDEAVANLKRVKVNLKHYKALVLKAAVEGRLVAGASAGESTTPVGEVRAGWRWTTVGELARVGTGATPSRSKPTYWNGGDVPWITSAAVNERYVDAAVEFVTSAALAETNLTLYPPGTLLVAMYGEGKTRGKCTELRIAATTNQALAALQVDDALRPYLKLFLEHSYEDMRKVASGGVQPNLNLGLVRAIRVPLPPLAEQRRIVAEVDRRLSIVREVEAEVDANLKRAQALRQAVLSRAFGGPMTEVSEAKELE